MMFELALRMREGMELQKYPNAKATVTSKIIKYGRLIMISVSAGFILCMAYLMQIYSD